jgi:hypothetical protein
MQDVDPEHSDDDDFSLCPLPTPMREHIWVKDLLDTQATHYQLLERHIKDVYTKWFGVPHNQKQPKLLIWPRLSYFFRSPGISERTPPSNDTRRKAQNQYPSICSFFGETGAGKSTLIKGLMQLRSPDGNLEVPVSGSDATSHLSTSGDVHLYADPSSVHVERPLFYAGMTENVP